MLCKLSYFQRLDLYFLEHTFLNTALFGQTGIFFCLIVEAYFFHFFLNKFVWRNFAPVDLGCKLLLFLILRPVEITMFIFLQFVMSVKIIGHYINEIEIVVHFWSAEVCWVIWCDPNTRSIFQVSGFLFHEQNFKTMQWWCEYEKN